jgi:hypothetical protein
MDRLDNLYVALVHAASVLLGRLGDELPAILLAVGLLVGGWLLAWLIALVVVRFLRSIGTERFADQTGVNDFLNRSGWRMRSSDLAAELCRWTTRLIFVQLAADQLDLAQFAQLVGRVIAFVPSIFLALLILFYGAYFARIAARVAHTHATILELNRTDGITKIASAVTMSFSLLIALCALGVSSFVLGTLFVGLVLSISLAVGLAFGLGGRSAAARILAAWSAKPAETGFAHKPKTVVDEAVEEQEISVGHV